jgi:sporulation related protein
MTAHIGQPTRSRRFIKLYLCTWAFLAVGALAYLGILAFPPLAEPTGPLAGVVKPGESKTLAEVRSVRGSLTEIRKDVNQLQEAVGERVVNEKVVETRLTALEDRVSTIDGPQPSTPQSSSPQQPTAAPPGLTTTVPGIRVLETTPRKVNDPRPAADSAPKNQESPAQSVAPAPFVPIETGSIAPKAEIVFGEAIVIPANQAEFAVQLGAGPSLQALRQSWGQLTERHAGALGALQPRVIAPRSEGGAYRLLAGPVPTKADAERICSELRVGPKGCFATPYAGAPL